MATSGVNFLVMNGIPVEAAVVPPVSAFLESTPGAYTTTRTHANGNFLLFWDRHLRRLANSAQILADHSRRPNSLFQRRSGFRNASYEAIRPAVEQSLKTGLQLSMGTRGEGQEVAVTALVNGRGDVYVHLGFYVPLVFGSGARLAVVGRGREVAQAKYSEWANIRKYMEKLRPPLTTELLLSNDGEHILEGSVTNFFVVCRKPSSDSQSYYSFEVQTAPISDGVLPGIVRQLVIEVCSKKGIPVREVAPRWSERDLWMEAFVTNSLRLLQHAEFIQSPHSCGQLCSESWKQVSWVEKYFAAPGTITTEIQNAILEIADASARPLSSFN